ncbi:MAG TPA: hypothetical protein DCM28_11525 [Phycisphaerales bacterium]|nr:hypothetical protein [Phycisphaerales bacterium]HCD30993.1 hypothetical protein [Phycisphaerales bacterium]|tara:strand:- start:2112 stop:2942 length:831 start_codon:yes stop_codon:yes gene_type:complete
MHNDLCEKHMIGNQTRERIVSASQLSIMRDLGMRMAGISQAKSDFAFVRHQPGVFQFLGCLSGHGQVWVNKHWETCSKDQAYLSPANVMHAYHAQGRKTWEVCWVMYDHAPWMAYLDLKQPVCCAIQTQPIHAAIACLHQESVGPAEKTVMRQWVLLIDQLVQRACKTWKKPSKLWQVWQEVDLNPGHPWQIDTLADIAQISNEHLRRLCKSELGIAPMQHVTKLRMQRATYLLCSTQMPIAQIATSVGYENAFAFTTAFKRHIKMSPTDYRLSHS